MTKAPTLPTITGAYSSSTQLNAAFRAIETSFANTLSLDGSTPNSMGADLDLNSNDILNAGVINATDYKLNGVDFGLDAAVTAASNYAQAAADSAAAAALYDTYPKGINFWDYLSAYSSAQKAQIAAGTYASSLHVELTAFRDALQTIHTAGGKPYGIIPSCTIPLSTAVNFGTMNHLTLETQGWVHFKGLGSTVGVTFNGDGLGYSGFGVVGLRIGQLVGSSATGTVGIYIDNCHFSEFKGLHSLGGSLAGIFINKCICTDFYKPWVSQSDGQTPTQVPAIGLNVTGTSGNQSSWCRILVPTMEDVPLGIQFDYTFGCTVEVGVAERCTDGGMLVTGNSYWANVNGTDFESNTNYDIKCFGETNKFTGVHSGGTSLFSGSTCKNNQLIGGFWNVLTFDSATTGNVITNTEVTTLTNSSTGVNRNRISNVRDSASNWRDRWITATPTVTAGSGTLTAYTATMEYFIRGNTVDVNIAVSIVTNGTGASSIVVALPAAVIPAIATSLSGIEDGIATKGVVGAIAAGFASLVVYFSDGTYPGANGARIQLSGTYRLA